MLICSSLVMSSCKEKEIDPIQYEELLYWTGVILNSGMVFYNIVFRWNIFSRSTSGRTLIKCFLWCFEVVWEFSRSLLTMQPIPCKFWSFQHFNTQTRQSREIIPSQERERPHILIRKNFSGVDYLVHFILVFVCFS